MSSRTNRPGRELKFDRGRIMEEEPMNRYIHPICLNWGTPACAPRCENEAVREGQCRILETLACQNQLLIDILGAVNALTAATLSAQSRQ